MSRSAFARLCGFERQLKDCVGEFTRASSSFIVPMARNRCKINIVPYGRWFRHASGGHCGTIVLRIREIKKEIVMLVSREEVKKLHEREKCLLA